jgi:hypothetical protein
MRGLRRVLVAALVVAACARMAAPPGGPPRNTPPVLLGIFPDSGVAPCDFRGVADFQFDEVTSEGATPNFGDGHGTLESLVLFSPDTAVPVVQWHRDRITVRPRGGWRPNRTYHIELLPGIADLHNNISKTGRTIAFTTCGPPPTRTLSGRAIEWGITPRAVPQALIEAFHLPDSARYRSQTDSTGHFRLTGLPDGPYLVVATIDQNRRRRRGPTDAWDSVRVGATRDTTGEIWVFARDTLPPRITEVTRQDSQSILVTFAKPVDPAMRIDSTAVHVRLVIGNDSVSIGTRSAYPKALDDSIEKAFTPPPKKDTTAKGVAKDSAARVDSLRKDSIARVPRRVTPGRTPRVVAPVDPPKQVRPPLGNSVVIRTMGQVQLGKRYFIEIRGVRTAGGQTGPPLFRLLTTPNPPTAADSAKAKAKADSATARLKADSLKADSTTRVKPDSANPLKRR